MQQVSLESYPIAKNQETAIRFKPACAIKRCDKCKELKPIENFERRSDTKRLRSTCRECYLANRRSFWHDNKDRLSKESHECYILHRDERISKQHDYYWSNRDKINQKRRTSSHDKEYSFLYRDVGHNRAGLFIGTGFCLICGEASPLLLENHHVSPDSDVVVSLCSNCHNLYRTSNRIKHMRVILNAIENSKNLWNEKDEPRGSINMWNDNTTMKEAIDNLKSNDIEGYEINRLAA